MNDYEMLKRFGHSPLKAYQIVLDAKRGDLLARQWVALARDQEQRRDQ